MGIEKFKNFEVVRDCEIIHFMPIGFGEDIDNDVSLQRELVVKNCSAKFRGKFVGHSVFRVLVNMGLVQDGSPSKETKLTMRGQLFLQQELPELFSTSNENGSWSVVSTTHYQSSSHSLLI